MYARIEVKTTQKIQMIDILELLKVFVASNKIMKGIVTIQIPHTTAAITLNKNYDPVVINDIVAKMNELIPRVGGYANIEGNSAANIQASLFGHSETLIIEDGRIELGMFQSVYLCEFDGPRKRFVNFKCIEG